MNTLLLLMLASPAFAASKIDAVAVKPGSKPSDVEISVSVTRGGGDCDLKVDFGDGRGEVLDFGLATTRTLKHTYRSAGTFIVSVKGTGKRPCDGVREVPVKVVAEEKKQAEAAKAEKKAAAADKVGKKKAEKKKAEKKEAAKKSAETKKSDASKDQ